MPINTCDDFIGLLQKSQLLNSEQLGEARRLANGFSEPTAVARKLVQHNLLSRWQAQELLKGRHSLMISKYRLLDLVGMEPMGPVYLAQHTQMDRRVVLKTLATRDGNTAAAIDRFLIEAQTLAKLDHRNLSHVYDVDREGDFYYLVIEHVQGRSLQQAVDDDGPMSSDAAAGFVALAAGALAHAHQRGIFHLGVRPNRIVVDSQGELKVLDIGVARLADAEDSPNTRREPGESASDYLSPEQVLKQEPYDARTDVYSLGCVLFFLLAGRPPIAEGTEEQRRAQRCQQPPRDVRTRRKDVPAELAQICLRMMARRPKERYESCAEVAAALEGWLKKNQTNRAPSRAKAAAARPREGVIPEPVIAGNGAMATGPPPPLPERPGEPAEYESGAHPVKVAEAKPLLSQRNIVIVAGAAAVVAVIGIVAAVMMMRGRPAEPIAETTPLANGATPVAAIVPPVDDVIAFIPLGQDRARVSAGLKCEKQPDGSFLIVGPGSLTANYTIIVQLNRRDFTGLRLDSLSDAGTAGTPQLTFGLGDVRAEMASNDRFMQPAPVKFSTVETDAEKSAGNLNKAIEVEPKSTWPGTGPNNARHWSIFWLDKPLAPSKGAANAPFWLRFVIEPQLGNMQVLRRFQLRGVTGRPQDNPAGSPAPSATEIIATPAAPKSSALAYWRFEAPPKTPPSRVAGEVPPAVEDMSGNRNHLYAPRGTEGAVRFASKAWRPVVPGTGAPNQQSLEDAQAPPANAPAWGLITDASRSKTAADMATTKLDAWTVEATFQLMRNGQSHCLIGKDGPSASGGPSPLQLLVRGDNELIQIEAVDSSNTTRQVISKTPAVAGHWYNVAAVSNGKILSLWIDALDGQGFQKQGESPFRGKLAESAGPWVVGRGFADGALVDDAMALIDEVRISATALEPNQLLMYRPADQLAIEKTANANRTAPAAPAVPSAPMKFHVLKEITFDKVKDLTFAPQPDGTFLVEGPNPASVIYTMRAQTDLTDLRGFRLEAVADKKFPGSGPGRFPDGKLAGDFIVTQFSVLMASRPAEKRPAQAPLTIAKADFSQERFDVASALTGKVPRSGWGIAPAIGKGHWATFTSDKPFGYPGGTWLTIRIAQTFGKGFTLGRFRVTAITGDQPGEDPALLVKDPEKPKNPFEALKEPIDLPRLPEAKDENDDARTAETLGHIEIPADTPVKLQLLGGDAASDSGPEFTLEPSPKAPQRWNVRLVSDSKSSGPIIAQLAVVQGDLKFHWTDKAAGSQEANYLRNCVLEISLGDGDDKTHGLILRKPVQVDELSLGLGKPAAKMHREIAWLPKNDQVKIEIQIDNKKYPVHTIDNGTFPAQKKLSDKNKPRITFHAAGEPSLFVSIESSLRRGILYLNTETSYQSSGKMNDKGMRFDYAAEEKEIRRYTAARDRLQELIKQAPEPAKKQAQAQLQTIKTSIDQINKFLARVQAIEKVGPVPYRVFFTVGKYDVVLLDTNNVPKE